MTSSFQDKIKEISAPLGELISCDEMTPDASLRRYYRLVLKGRVENAVVMQFLSTASPEASGLESVPSDEACVSLSKFFVAHGIAVPEIYLDSRQDDILVIEDLGDKTLGEILLNPDGQSSKPLFEYYSRAIDQILALQEISLKQVKDHFVFKRSFSKTQYIKEMKELADFSFSLLSEEESLSSYFSFLAAELSDLPTTVSHRDYHSWNIMIDKKDDIRVIDFQDALMATRCYDLVSLLNDRDTDSYLGAELYQKLLKYFYNKISFKKEFFFEYDRVLLQRDIKVVGRFAKLSSERGLKHYEQWIPGTLTRIGSTLARLSKANEVYASFLEILMNTYPEVAKGALVSIPFLDSKDISSEINGSVCGEDK